MFLFLGAARSSLLNTIVFTTTHTHRQTQIERQADIEKLKNKKYLAVSGGEKADILRSKLRGVWHVKVYTTLPHHHEGNRKYRPQNVVPSAFSIL